MNLTAYVDCPSCDALLEGQWHDDSIDIEQLDRAPEAEVLCPECNMTFTAVYPGWTEFGGAG